MKVLTIKQPWAPLIVDGVKDVENRMWKLPAKYVGQRILIHAGKDDSFYKQQMETVFSIDQLIHISNRYNGTHLSNADFQLGAIIGSVEITGCVTDSESVWAMPDHFHFTLANAIRFPQPIPAKGKLGFWEYDFTEEKKKIHDHPCTHEFVSREYMSQPYGTCMSCGMTVFN